MHSVPRTLPRIGSRRITAENALHHAFFQSGEEDDGPALEDNGAAEDESEDDEITLEDNSAGVATGAEPGVLL